MDKRISFVWKFKGFSHCVTANKWTHMFHQTWENLDFVDCVINIFVWQLREKTILLKPEGIIRDSISAVLRFEIQYTRFEIRDSISAVRDSRLNICCSSFDIQYVQFEIRNSISAVRVSTFIICSSRFEIQYLQFESRHSISVVRDSKLKICSSRFEIQYYKKLK